KDPRFEDKVRLRTLLGGVLDIELEKIADEDTRRDRRPPAAPRTPAPDQTPEERARSAEEAQARFRDSLRKPDAPAPLAVVLPLRATGDAE
ncbi:MAG TPA: hypothetical protein VGK73_36435, partial [Polyangiaceae bacterium]